MLLLDEAQVSALLTPRDALAAVQRAFLAQAEQQTVLPLRAAVITSNGLLGSMPGAVLLGGRALGAKLVTFFPGNAQGATPTHQALIALFDAEDGRPIALMDGRYITEIRTAAASALATRVLGRPQSSIAAILGTGVQARAHAHALVDVLSLRELRVWGRNRLHAETLARDLAATGIAARAADTAAQACAGAHVICTTTSTHDPVLALEDVESGAHINAVGACTPRMREISADLMAAASIFVDSIEGGLSEAGDIILAMRDGALPAAPRLTLLADAVAGKTVGRTSDDEITLFKSLGIALEDLTCAALVYERAVERSIGTSVQM
ncbi:MAG TPA: ornithine cyclodeaminase family protein [Candidatus Binatus sp.]|nr:ornithine cyclodeaminase family protein [Candidatus Binatus sp.]